jgi:hypothetical protein
MFETPLPLQKMIPWQQESPLARGNSLTVFPYSGYDYYRKTYIIHHLIKRMVSNAKERQA